MGRHSVNKKYTPEHAKPSKYHSGHNILAYTASFAVAVTLSAGIVGYVAIDNVQSNIQTVDLTSAYTTNINQGNPTPVIETETPTVLTEEQEIILPDVSIGSLEENFSILIVGSDTREGQGENFGTSTNELNDVNILVKVNVEKNYMIAVSFPRDLLVSVPECTNGNTTTPAADKIPLNNVLSRGGLPCVALTIEQLTGTPIVYAGMLTFTGVANISTAIGGVPVCVNAPLVDKYSGLNFPEAGEYEIEGWEALAFLRTRSSIGDGSDLSRINLQQQYLSSMLRKITEEQLLDDLPTLYNLAVIVSREALLSSSLGSIDTLVAMARSLNTVSLENIMFVQFPVGSAGDPENYPGKVIPKQPYADTLIELLQNNEFFILNKQSSGAGTNTIESFNYDTEELTILNGANGQSAADITCSNVR